MRWFPGGLAGGMVETAATVSGSAARRTWAATAWLVAATIAMAVLGYSLSLQVANERQETERLARQNRSLEADLKALDAELRVRMRMPQLQSWNDRVLGLVPISASQYLESPLRLADYGQLPGAVPPPARPQYAVRDHAPQPEAATRPQLVRAELPVRAAPPPAVPLLARPAEEAPDELLQQVRLVFGAPSALAP